MSDQIKFSEEAQRLARKAEETARPSEKRMLETHSRFYEALAGEDDQPVESKDAPASDPN